MAGGRPGRRRRLRTPHPNVAFRSRVRPARPQAHQRIHHKRQRLEIEPNLFDRFRSSQFVDRRHRQNRLALIHRLHREPAISALICRKDGAVIVDAVGRRGQIVRREDCLDAGHRQRRARIDAPDARVRHRAEQQLAEQHAVRAIVFRVLRTPRHLRDEVGRRVVLPDQFVLGRGHILGIRHVSPSADFPHRASWQ